jgi:hypothetical protein
VGGLPFDAAEFDLAEVNAALRFAGSAAWRREREQFYL